MWSDLSFDVRSYSPESFGPSWGLTWEAWQDEEVRYSGGGKHHSTKESDQTRLFREHHEYLDGLREIQAQISDDIQGARIIAMRTDMEVPDAILPPAMRGTVPAARVVDVLGAPLILLALALLIDEADD